MEGCTRRVRKLKKKTGTCKSAANTLGREPQRNTTGGMPALFRTPPSRKKKSSGGGGRKIKKGEGNNMKNWRQWASGVKNRRLLT